MVDTIVLILIIAILFLSIIIHEYSHGRVADFFGDPTPRAAGRLTLNPLAHIDPFGTILLPLIIILVGKGHLPPVGYAKPVPINPTNFSLPRKGIMWVGLAGPLSNLALAVIFALLRIIVFFPFLRELCAYGVWINVALAMFNLVPIPPLDGSRAMASLLPYKYAYHYIRLEKYGFIIVLLLFFSGALQYTLLPLISFICMLMGVPISL